MSQFLEVANQIERGVTVVHIRLSYGDVEWRASSSEIHGRSRAGLPFTITNVFALSLLAWLRGMPLAQAFPKMDPADRALLATGFEFSKR